jgi:GNAT superfamily N-acetyltransferase
MFNCFLNGEIAGYTNVIFKSKYQPFFEQKIPGINDLVVLSSKKRNGIGNALLQFCEQYTKENGFSKIGLGVGLYMDYGAAQRIYTKRGYYLDGRGLMYNNKPVSPGNNVFVDDELLLYLTKDLK